MTDIERIDQLREALHQHNYNYYVLNAPEISDQDFDQLMHELQDLEKKTSGTFGREFTYHARRQ